MWFSVPTPMTEPEQKRLADLCFPLGPERVFQVNNPILNAESIESFFSRPPVFAPVVMLNLYPVPALLPSSLDFARLTIGPTSPPDEIPLRPETMDFLDFIEPDEVGEQIDVTTNHAWLVVLGRFAQSLGLISQLEEASLEQKTGPNGKPQSKLIEFLVGILGGIEYLKDLNDGPNPIAMDPTVAEAWAQKVFSHYSQVSRTLDAADEQTLEDVIEALHTVSSPYIEQAVNETLAPLPHLTIDLDLTGREVSPNSTDYPGAEFGHMANEVAKGYQAAVTSLVCERWGRLMLTLQRYGGRTHSRDCLQEAVKEFENLLGRRPRRRTALVEARIQELTDQISVLQDKLTTYQQKEQNLKADLTATEQDIELYKSNVEKLELFYQSKGWEVRPNSKLVKARRKYQSAIKRKKRLAEKVTLQARRQIKIGGKMAPLQDEQLTLKKWLSTLETENQSNPNPIKIVLRVDAGFSSGKNLAWLIECGYTILTKAHHSSSAHKWLRSLPSSPCWTKVGKNAEAILVKDASQNNCAYAYQAMLVRYQLGAKIRLTALLYYDESPPPDLASWFKWYNQRQTIEAGIKELKGVFTLRTSRLQTTSGSLSDWDEVARTVCHFWSQFPPLGGRLGQRTIVIFGHD